MARKLADLCDDIIYEAGQVHPRPARIKSLAREIKRKYGQSDKVDGWPVSVKLEALNPCDHPAHALTRMTTGDGTPVDFCTICKRNFLS